MYSEKPYLEGYKTKTKENPAKWNDILMKIAILGSRQALVK